MVHELLAPGPQESYDLDANDESLPRLQEWLEHHGDICRAPSESRPGDGLVIHNADDIRHVLLTNRANYVKGVGLERVRLLLGNGLIVSEGEFWSRQRRMTQPAFQGQVIRSFSALMQRANQDLLERWSVHASRGDPINLTRDLSELTLNVVLRALFSTDFDRLVDADGASPFDLLTRETRRDLPFAAKFRALTHWVREMIDARRAEQRIEMDILSTLMEARDRDTGQAMPERALLDEIMTLIVAGHETTASALNWTWHLLSQNVEIEERLHQALVGLQSAKACGEESPEEDPYVEQVLLEALRLYPPVWLFSRRAVGDDELSGYHVAAGTDIFICPYLLHRHASHWDRPEAFDPSRFAPEAVEARHRFAFLPFSAGPRYCIGASFAMAEMRTHLSLLARQFRLIHVGAELPKPEFQINLRTQQDLLMRVAVR